MPEKSSGIKSFGKSVKMGFSKLFSKKEKKPVMQYEEQKEFSNPLAQSEYQIDDIKLEDREHEEQDIISSEIVKDK